MEGKDEESTYISFNGALNFKSFEVSLKRKESILTFDQQRLELCKSTDRIKSFSSKSGCSKSCTKYKKTSSNGYIQSLPDICFKNFIILTNQRDQLNSNSN